MNNTFGSTKVPQTLRRLSLPHSRVFPRQARGLRRKTAWSLGPSNVVESRSAAGPVLWDGAAQAVGDGLTIVRIRGELVVQLNLATTAGDGFESFAAGLCIVSENAFGVGVTAVPSPITDIGWDGWMWYHTGGQITSLVATASLVSRSFHSLRIPIDTKAMRKIRDTDILIGVFELGTEIGAAAVEFSARSRVLSKIP